MALPEDVKRALLDCVHVDQILRTEVRELLGIEESKRNIMLLKEIVEAQQIKLVRAVLEPPANTAGWGRAGLIFASMTKYRNAKYRIAKY